MLIPYLVWTVIYTAISSIKYPTLFACDLVINALTGTAASPLYYILLLLQMELLLPLILRVWKNKGARIVLWLITPLYLIYVYTFYFKSGVHPPLYGTLFPAYLIFYLMGLEMREACVGGSRKWMVLPVLALFFSFSEGFFLSGIGMPLFGVSQLKISSFLYSAAIIAVLVRRERMIIGTRGIGKAMVRIGDDSYAIFYLHCLWIKIVGAAFRQYSLALPWIFSTVIYALIIVAMCEITIYIVRAVAEKIGCRKYLKYIGF